MATPPTADGLLLVDKPAGVSSHDVVGAARRALGQRRIGHAGTLDPFATGLLVLLVGRATRLLPHLPGEPKVYEAVIRFGAETDTEDLEGAVTREAPLPTRNALLAALPQLTGDLDQVPPAYSAKRVDGTRAYKKARAGETVTLAPVRVRVHRWAVTDLRLDEASERVREAQVTVTVGGGTYVRSLARDLARAASSAAHLVALRRTRAGVFDVSAALTVEDLREGRARLRPALDALEGFPREPLGAESVGRVVRGIDVPATVDGAWGALTDAERGVLVALAEREGERWRPRVVMHEVAAEGADVS
jgi:tRNA pseudouridine55 synthase